ncbi:MAG: hypothetical protein HOE62_06750 [Alphaproteobacteria bacterium]|jgi:predicted DNA-binding transcriptional regulator AlpA|nr:hypothetical protein [Alphaproteobacteria bacterium]MBT4543546.1 hypothetical protein [Alphaproteobacteria bacterium]MBT7746676.1 hypothetical protein [Alphaproteobacteria bacterium]
MNTHLENLGLEPLVSSDVAMAVAGWKSQTTLLTAIKSGKFPQPDRVDGRIRRWFPSTLRHWQNNQSRTAA